MARSRSGLVKRRRRESTPSEESSTAHSARPHRRLRMDPHNSGQERDGFRPFFGGAAMPGFQGGFNSGLPAAVPPYPYFYGLQQQSSTGFMPFPVQSSPPSAPGHNQTGPSEPVENDETSPAAPALDERHRIDGGRRAGPSGGRRKVAARRSKLSNFSPSEDVFLVKSWLEISCDPITNTGQKREGFWTRILGRYNEKRGPYPERTVRSLQSRWGEIKAEGAKFAGYMVEVLRSNPSGMNDGDKTSLALADFASVENYPFAFMHCWDLLKDEPKWMEISHKGPQQDDIDPSGDHIPPTSNTIDLDPDVPCPDSSAGKRPMGRDAAKGARKKANCSSGSASSSEYASKLQDLSIQKLSIWQDENAKRNTRYEHMATIEEMRYEEIRKNNDAFRKHKEYMASIEAQKVQLMREKLEMQRTREEKLERERILAMNLDDCASPALRRYYQSMQEEILEEIEAKRHNHARQ